MLFPNINPTKVELDLPEYLGNSQEFNTSDLSTKPTQYVGLSLMVKLEWAPVTQEQRDDLKAYYDWHQKRWRFAIPKIITDLMPTQSREILNIYKAKWFVIVSEWVSAPTILNDECSLYSVNLVIKSV